MAIVVTNPKTILILGRNLFFLPRIQIVSKPLGIDVRRVVDEKSFWTIHEDGSVMLLFVDLEADASFWPSVLRRLVENAQNRPYIVAFGPHTDVTTMSLARNLGCDDVFSKGEFITKLDQTIRLVRDR